MFLLQQFSVKGNKEKGEVSVVVLMHYLFIACLCSHVLQQHNVWMGKRAVLSLPGK